MLYWVVAVYVVLWGLGILCIISSVYAISLTLSVMNVVTGDCRYNGGYNTMFNFIYEE